VIGWLVTKNLQAAQTSGGPVVLRPKHKTAEKNNNRKIIPNRSFHRSFNMSTRVYLGRLARDCRDRDIEKLFRGYGDIREINLKNGFGFVEFRDNRDAEDVVYDFHGKEFLGER
jgi:RNA recognition motif-containing protein